MLKNEWMMKEDVTEDVFLKKTEKRGNSPDTTSNSTVLHGGEVNV